MDKKKYYKKIFNYFKEEKKKIILYAFTSIFIVIFNTITPLFSAKVLEAITSVNLNNMLKYAIFVFLVDILDGIIKYFNNDLTRRIQNNVSLKIKENVSKEMFNLEMKNFDKEGTGFFANRISSEPNRLANIFTNLRYNGTAILTELGVYIFVFYLSFPLGIYITFTGLINAYLTFKRLKRWENERKIINEFDEKYTSDFSELIRGIKDIKVLNLKDTLIKKTIKSQREQIKLEYESSKKDELNWQLESFINVLSELFFIIIGVILISNGYLTGSNMLILYMYKGRAKYLFNDISNAYRTYREYNLSLERLYEIIDGNKYQKEKWGNTHLDKVDGNIEFRKTIFSYDKENVLNKIEFKIEKNQTIGIVGKSGVGKTTIFNLINKLYSVSNNQIFIDNVDINMLDEKTIRENIATITQNPYIFNMSIKDNLKIVKPSITDEEIKEKCKLCLLDEYVETLDKKYDTLVGENGVILSGGLKQRLAIARALIKNSKIILLDEATSSMDNETQDYIQKSIKKIRKDYTILIIAHRLSTVIDCDKILVIDNGKVIGFDTHNNLIKNNKIYKRLYIKELM